MIQTQSSVRLWRNRCSVASNCCLPYRISQRTTDHNSFDQHCIMEASTGKAQFLTKKQREELALQRLQQKREEEEKRQESAVSAHDRFISGRNVEEKQRKERQKREREEEERQRRHREENIEAAEQEHELKTIREHYLGGAERPRRLTKPSEKFARVFQFEWEAGDDTAKDDLNPLYSKRMKINALFGRGYIAGVDQREQRKDSNFLMSLSEKRLLEAKQFEEQNEQISEEEKAARDRARAQAMEQFRRSQTEENRKRDKSDSSGMGKHWSDKSLDEMSDRDWRIFREDFDIRIQGGRATLPLRFWSEANLPAPIMQAIEALGYEKPSPIQRQAIPVGLARRDIIGIAETGSGKTCAFLVPMLCYLLQLPPHYAARCADQGPLAIVMAPTRELAQQIDEECNKIGRFTSFHTVCVVGGQNIEDQGFRLRRGVEIVIGTPGRMLDCIENNYMVLNQCNYVILDEADRMIDMGFEPQVVAVLDAMGGLLKSEDEEQAEQQLQSSQSIFRVTAMFSATMPTEVELIARTYLRHPVMVRIGDVDSGKNKRIEQRVFFIAEGQKKTMLLDELRKLNSNDKVIVFINTQKVGDTLSWQLESANFKVGVLHGGRSQDQREETLEHFRASKIQILVATDVAGRGLDIPDVNLVINYDCPKKIQSYCHRIGRTGRAGKFGVAMTYITDADTEVMYDMKNYLDSTDSAVPPQLANHPAATAAPGSRDDKGRLLAVKKDTTMFAK